MVKEIDFVGKNIWIEVDGSWHFGTDFTKKRYSPARIHERDILLNKEAGIKNVMLIRLGLDCWRGNGHYKLKPEWMEELKKMIQHSKSGVYLCGECYQQGLWASDICATWKYLIRPTTSPLPMV
jgi:hypothetical protein